MLRGRRRGVGATHRRRTGERRTAGGTGRSARPRRGGGRWGGRPLLPEATGLGRRSL